MTSCIVRFKEVAPRAAKRRKLGPEDKPGPKMVLRALGQLLDLGDTYVVPPLPGVPPGTSGVARARVEHRSPRVGPEAEKR